MQHVALSMPMIVRQPDSEDNGSYLNQSTKPSSCNTSLGEQRGWLSIKVRHFDTGTFNTTVPTTKGHPRPHLPYPTQWTSISPSTSHYWVPQSPLTFLSHHHPNNPQLRMRSTFLSIRITVERVPSQLFALFHEEINCRSQQTVFT